MKNHDKDEMIGILITLLVLVIGYILRVFRE